jgi:hypothetical protein
MAQMPELPLKNPVQAKIETFINQSINAPIFDIKTGYYKKDSTKLDTFIINIKTKSIALYFDKQFAYAPFRPNTIEWLKEQAKKHIGELYQDYSIELYANNKILESYIPNYFVTTKKNQDNTRLPKHFKRKTQALVTNLSKQIPEFTNLHNIHIALWHSHGWYYEPTLDRWEWQRARLFQTVEDLSTMAYTLQNLVPMLENAGANVFLPRERSWQTHEVIVDNNGSSRNSIYTQNITQNITQPGFAIGNQPYTSENPFTLGSCVQFKSDKNKEIAIEWIPDIPETGEYPVYVSYHHDKNNADDALYTIHHMGGNTQFQINQQMGGETWIYLGTFQFDEGLNPAKGKVTLSGKTHKNKQMLSADAVRFGGGMGNVSRHGKISERPRYQEAARYYLQYAGMPDTLVWLLNTKKENDYIDDYQSRGEWINYLMGAPNGPLKNRNTQGLEIPIDLAFAFHTDAGFAASDSVVGTLAIYSTTMNNTSFPNGISKMASRDLSDLIQSQIVLDLRMKYDTSWIRRGLWDKPYSEAFRPNVPTMLLELLSHQNFMDARLGQEPQFRFDVSRAIYKGMLRFLSVQYGFDYIVQPLPITNFSATFSDTETIQLNWKSVPDPLEPTALANGYLVYTRKNNDGFNNGQFTKTPNLQIKNPEPGVIYSFKVTAWNKGGESFPSETLSVGLAPNSKGMALIVNAFDRIAGPAALNESTMAGFMDRIDEGVAYQCNIHTTGTQYDFLRSSPWLDDDSPGFGASGAELETKTIPGNTFDFSCIHGKTLLNAGYSFASTSDEAFEQASISGADYFMLDYLAGEEKTHYMPKNDSAKHFTIFNQSIINSLKNYLESGGNLLITGAYIGTDVHQNQQDSVIGALLKYKWRTHHASQLGQVIAADTSTFDIPKLLRFNTQYHPKIYKVETPDAIEPYDSTANTMMRYTENNMSAGVFANTGTYKVAAFGFPLESILDKNQKNSFMEQIIHFFKAKETKH